MYKYIQINPTVDSLSHCQSLRVTTILTETKKKVLINQIMSDLSVRIQLGFTHLDEVKDLQTHILQIDCLNCCKF